MLVRVALILSTIYLALTGVLLANGVSVDQLGAALTANWGATSLTIIGGLIVLSSLFLFWKFEIQPRANGMRFNPSQNKNVVDKVLSTYPKFYDLNDPEFDWAEQIEANSQEIITEIRALIAKSDADPSGGGFNTAYNNKVLSLSDTWKTLNLVSYGAVNSDLLPRTQEILRKAPNMFNCNVSRLGPKSKVKFHAGESTSYIRCHMGVTVPAEKPISAMYVGDESEGWTEGKIIAFCDAHWHGAENGADSDRYVLIFDVMPKRLGWYTKQFCALMVAMNVTQYFLPGRMSLDEPLWRPQVFLGYLSFSTFGLPLMTALYVYFRYLCGEKRPAWLGRLRKAGFAFYY